MHWAKNRVCLRREGSEIANECENTVIRRFETLMCWVHELLYLSTLSLMYPNFTTDSRDAGWTAPVVSPVVGNWDQKCASDPAASGLAADGDPADVGPGVGRRLRWADSADWNAVPPATVSLD